MYSRRRGAFSRLAAVVGALVLITWLASLAGVLLWQRLDSARPASAIVVLGAAQYAGHPSPVLRARIDHAVELWRRGLAPLVIVTGGVGSGDTTSEAAVAERYAERRGIPCAAIRLEPHGRTTRESMAAVAAMLHGRAAQPVILVSDPFHMLRLSILARRLGLRPYVSPTRTSPISANRSESLRYVLSESIKVPFALLMGLRQ